MAGLINELMDNMAEMSACAGELVKIAGSKREIVIKNDVEALKDLTSAENTLVGRFQKLEKNAAGLIGDIAMVLNENPKTLTLSRLGELIKDQGDHGAFIRVYGELSAGLVALKAQNDQNRILIENALDYIDYTVNVIRSTYADDDNIVDTKN